MKWIEQGWRGEEVVETTQRDLELIDIAGVGIVFGKLRHNEELDVFTSSIKQSGLENNDACCSLKEGISE